MLNFTEFLLQRRKRYDTFFNAFQDYHRHVTGQDLERLAEYRAFRKVIYNEERDGEDEEEGVTQSPGLKGSNFDFGSYTYDGESVSGIDPSSLVSDYTASQMLQASMRAIMESHVARLQHRIKPTVPMLDKAVDQEAHTNSQQESGEKDMESKSDDDGDNDSKKDGIDDVMDVQKEGGDILNTKDNGQENLQEKLDHNPGQKNLGQEHQA
ncbi:hypothetical protein CPC16_010107 [Podila verticillata]|nr:hypothetical protein CPC16_010107 [Podila verticillata]